MKINNYYTGFIKFFLLGLIISFFSSDIVSQSDINNSILKRHIIISLTSTKKKLKSLLVDRLIKSLLIQTVKPYKILISVKKGFVNYISDYLKNLIKKRIVKLIIIAEDFKSFNRYYYVPDEYKKYIIIVVDDDIILEKNSIENLFKSFKLFPNAISARRVYKLNFNEKGILKSFKYWNKDYKEEAIPKFSLFAIHGEGALFPPNKLNFNNDFIYYFKNALKADDYVIKYFELKKNLKTTYVNNLKKFRPINTQFYKKWNKILSLSLSEYQLVEDYKKKKNFTINHNIIKEKVIITNETKNYFLNTINKNTINKDTLLVSMTSFPERIYGVKDVFFSLLYQSADISSYQCFLTLAIEEFINGVEQLPEELQKLIINGWVKIIWYHNIYSHKKLMPILKIFPENDILIVDDDVIRNYIFIETFQHEHKSYPNDIICGTFAYCYDKDLNMKRLTGFKSENALLFNAVPNIIFQTARPANGFGGVLYPSHTFSDERFFNESLYMQLSPTSDESWQFAFLMIENKIIRQTSIIFDNSVNFVENTQNMKTCLHKVNKDKLSVINEKLIKTFPEYKFNSLERQKKIIVSITSNKNGIKNLNLVLKSIFNNTMKPSKIVLTLYKNDLIYLTKYLNDLISEERIELIVTDIDLKSHQNYFEVMKKYKDYAIITITDDIIYTTDLIETLYNSYINYPNCIHARCVHKIGIKNYKVLPYNKWLKNYTFEFNPSFYLFSEPKGGILYPPNILNISNDNIYEITKCSIADDIYLKHLSMKKNIQIIWVPNNFSLGLEKIVDNNSKKYELKKKNDKIKDYYLKKFPLF